MPRSAGITVSAVVVFFGSAFTILAGAGMLFAEVFLANSSRMANQPPFLRYALVFDAVLCFAFGGWGVASGVGLLQVKRLARISMIVYAAILLVFTLPMALLMAFVPLPNTTNGPNVPTLFTAFMRIGMVFFYGAFAALGGFWLYFFNRGAVKDQFRGKQLIETTALAQSEPLAGSPRAIPAATTHARPLSISIIAWFLLVGCVFAPFSLWFDSIMFPGVQLPICILGVFVSGRSAMVILVLWMVVQAIAAVGLLKLKNWGRLTTIVLQCVGMINIALMFGIPANRAKFQLFMESAVRSMNARMPQPVPFTFPIWLGFAASIPVFIAVLWFLVTTKKAFNPAAAEPAVLTS